MTLTDAQIEEFIQDALEENFELLRLESGHSLAADVKATALNQALLYWRKLKDVATRVTETEVRLNLPGQESPEGRKFGIEGIVDIVREEGRTVMYDIKTHDADHVRDHVEGYEQQLNVYAHIWQNLRGQPLDEVAIIATAYPERVKEALAGKDPEELEYTLERWNPLVELKFNPDHVDEIIADFGRVVDRVESGKFEPASLEKLQSRYGDRNALFATTVCRNCDARFSCESYRQYAFERSGRAELSLRNYLEDYGPDVDQQEWLSGGLESSTNIENLK